MGNCDRNKKAVDNCARNQMTVGQLCLKAVGSCARNPKVVGNCVRNAKAVDI